MGECNCFLQLKSARAATPGPCPTPGSSSRNPAAWHHPPHPSHLGAGAWDPATPRGPRIDLGPPSPTAQSLCGSLGHPLWLSPDPLLKSRDGVMLLCRFTRLCAFNRPIGAPVRKPLIPGVWINLAGPAFDKMQRPLPHASCFKPLRLRRAHSLGTIPFREQHRAGS